MDAQQLINIAIQLEQMRNFLNANHLISASSSVDLLGAIKRLRTLGYERSTMEYIEIVEPSETPAQPIETESETNEAPTDLAPGSETTGDERSEPAV